MQRSAPVRPGRPRPGFAGALGLAIALLAPAPAGAEARSKLQLAAAPTQSSGAGSSLLAPLLAPRYYKTSELDVRPGIMTRVEPEYPESAARRFLSGKVQLKLFISASGMVDRVTILSAKPPGYFEGAAERAFSAARFSPGMKGNKAVRSQLTLEVSFDSPPPPAMPERK